MARIEHIKPAHIEESYEIYSSHNGCIVLTPAEAQAVCHRLVTELYGDTCQARKTLIDMVLEWVDDDTYDRGFTRQQMNYLTNRAKYILDKRMERR